MSCDLCTYAQLILNKSVAFPHRGCKSRAERTTPIVVTKHYCSVGTTHGCRWARPCHDHCRLQRDQRSNCIGDLGRGDAVFATQVMTAPMSAKSRLNQTC